MLVVVIFPLFAVDVIKQRTDAKDTKADPAAADSWRYEADR